MCGLKYVSHRHKFIYFEVPKTGTSSLLSFLTEHASITKMDRRYEFLDYPEYLRFAFVRNPWDVGDEEANRFVNIPMRAPWRL